MLRNRPPVLDSLSLSSLLGFVVLLCCLQKWKRNVFLGNLTVGQFSVWISQNFSASIWANDPHSCHARTQARTQTPTDTHRERAREREHMGLTTLRDNQPIHDYSQL